MARFTSEAGLMESVKAEVCNVGKTALNLRAIGVVTWRTGKAVSFTPTETSTRELGIMIKHRDKGST
jgi:hypothetical protein